MNTCDLANC